MASVHDLPSTVRRAAGGDAVAQARLVTDFSALARATAVRLVDDPAAVDDVVQEAFVEVFAALALLRHPEAFPAWVRLAVRKHADRHRRTRRPTAPLDGVDPPSARSHHDDELVDQRETARQVRAALAGLRADDRHSWSSATSPTGASPSWRRPWASPTARCASASTTLAAALDPPSSLTSNRSSPR
jgi:DNA-directed RNA polymerase specialized sigma24 family protein